MSARSGLGVINQYLVGYSYLGFTCHSEESVRIEKVCSRSPESCARDSLGMVGRVTTGSKNRALHPQRHRGINKLAFLSPKSPLRKVRHKGCLILPLTAHPNTAVSRRLRTPPQRTAQCRRLKGAAWKEKRDTIQAQKRWETFLLKFEKKEGEAGESFV